MNNRTRTNRALGLPQEHFQSTPSGVESCDQNAPILGDILEFQIPGRGHDDGLFSGKRACGLGPASQRTLPCAIISQRIEKRGITMQAWIIGVASGGMALAA